MQDGWLICKMGAQYLHFYVPQLERVVHFLMHYLQTQDQSSKEQALSIAEPLAAK